MKLHKWLSAIILATAAPMVGCFGTTESYVAYEAPPPPREEVVSYRPGFVYIHGHWGREGDRWGWRSGYYERMRPGYVYSEGRWERRGGRHVWLDGGWRARAGVVVR